MSFSRKDHWQVARSRIGERCEHLRSGLLNISKTVRQRFLVSVPELDVVGCGRTGFELDGMANDKGGRFGFRFADLAGRLFAAVATVQKLMSLCCAQHKRIYVAMEFMWRSARVPAENKQICMNKRHIILLTDVAGTPSRLDCCARVSLAMWGSPYRMRPTLWPSSRDRHRRKHWWYRWRHDLAMLGWY